MVSTTMAPEGAREQSPTTERAANTKTSSNRANFRCKRGIAIYRRYADRIKQIAPWVYSVPSQSGRGVYHVYMKPGEESCSCPDYSKYHTRRDEEDESEQFFCKHYFAARLWKAKSEQCAACKGRFLVRHLTEVGEEHLTFYADDCLCAGCVGKHGLGMAS